MPIATAKAFRQQILKPAEGIFLFHARAIERLIEGQFGDQLFGISVPNLPYYLMPQAAFLFGLETENAEALSVIEGLRLPSYVILLPSPNEQLQSRETLDRLRYDYWSRSFEAEVARAWQMARDTCGDAADFGAPALRQLIGDHAYTEMVDVLDYDDLTLPIWDESLICRSFVAAITRLRYFAPGARSFFFPAIRNWAELDRWLGAGGLDLPPPLVSRRHPPLLSNSRPGSKRGAMGIIPLLPTALPYGQSDPDLEPALARIQAQHAPAYAMRRRPLVTPTTTVKRASRTLALRCELALRNSAHLRPRRSWPMQLWDELTARLSRLSGRLLFAPSLERFHAPSAKRPSRAWLNAGVSLFRHALVAAHRAERRGRFAVALIHLANARRLLARLERFSIDPMEHLYAAMSERELRCEQGLTRLLVTRLQLKPPLADQLQQLIHRLAAEDRGTSASSPARTVLGHLASVSVESRSDYYQIQLWQGLWRQGSDRWRQMLPFQSLLYALRSLQNARQRLEDIPWPLADMEQFTRILEDMTACVTADLDQQLRPRLQQAMREAEFLPRDHRENVAAHKMLRELLDVIAQRRHLKFTDVRDVVARNILRLPDPTLGEFFRGDRLRRFDRTAARALPGVYRPGEFYIKGLQQLTAPLFGTDLGRRLLRHLLVPAGAVFLVLKTLDLLLYELPWVDKAFHLTSTLAVTLFATLINVLFYTEIGRHIISSFWSGSRFLLYFLLIDGPRTLLRWPPVLRLLNTGLMRGLGRNLIQPLLVGILPLIPIMMLAVLVDEVPIPGLWLLGLAFALGTLARNTPGGRRFIDNLVSYVTRVFARINQTVFFGAIQQLLFFFKELTRRFAQAMYRVDESLTHHLSESRQNYLLKVIAAPLWHFFETLIQFYITVLIEPQVNPVKHFPIVTIGHKIMLPFLPAITAFFLAITHSLLPKWIGYPLVTLTVVMLPGLFGFLVWEFKENWKLYEANHAVALRNFDDSAQELIIEPAVIGDHGETMRRLLMRGFHSGALPKSFDRVRRVVLKQLRDQRPYPKRVRSTQRRLEAIERAICVFVDRELSFALRQRCQNPDCTLERVDTRTPRLATQWVELQIDLYPQQQQEPVQLKIDIALHQSNIVMTTAIIGQQQRISPACWQMIDADMRLFAGRMEARLAADCFSGLA